MNMSMRHRAVAGAMAGAVLLSMVACGTDAKEPSATALIQAIEANTERSVTLGSVYGADTTFDRAVSLCPYMSAEEVEGALGFAWKGASRLALEDESKGNILLVQGNRVNAMVPLVRTEVDLCTAPAETLRVISPGQSLKFVRGEEAIGVAGWTLQHG